VTPVKSKQNLTLSDGFNYTVLDCIADGVFTIDKDKKISFFNKAAEEITGVKRNQAIGRHCYDVLKANICDGHCELEKTMKNGRKVINKQVDIINKSGKRVPISISTAVLKDHEGNKIGGVETFRDLSVIAELKNEIQKHYSVHDIISKNHSVQQIIDILPYVAESDSTVLIEGPSGSGKELIARAIHNLSNRKSKPLIAINCGALPDNLLESELFGYVKGAFTDAYKDKPGRFALAEGGTIFLDEIGDVSPALQVRLLRVLQEREYEPLGSVAPVKTNVRIISATNKKLQELINTKAFREDLYYRLNIVKLSLPALMDRKEDIPLLVNHFIQKLRIKREKGPLGVSDEVMTCFMRYNFPGNIRELENIIERAFVLCRSQTIEISDLPEEIVAISGAGNIDSKAMKSSFGDMEAEILIRALNRNNWNRANTSEFMGINKTTLWRKMKKLGIEKREPR
jgi:PAS domain S-box-containing protein